MQHSWPAGKKKKKSGEMWKDCSYFSRRPVFGKMKLFFPKVSPVREREERPGDSCRLFTQTNFYVDFSRFPSKTFLSLWEAADTCVLFIR